MLQNIFSIISLLLTAYSFIIFIRILLSWFNLRNGSNGYSQNKIVQFLYSITDPYLNWFRRFRFLQFGMLDFSAMLGIFVLYFIANITSQIAMTGTISILYLIQLIIASLWSLASSIILISVVLLVVRIVFLQINKYSPLFDTLDRTIEPFVRKFRGYFSKKFTSYKTNLIIFTIVLFVARYLINIGVNFLINII